MGAGERARELEEGEDEGERLWTGTYSAGEEGDALTIGIGEDMVVLESLAVGHGRIRGIYIHCRRGSTWPTVCTGRQRKVADPFRASLP